MNRRDFAKGLGLGTIALGLGRPAIGAPIGSGAPSQVAITLDDFTWSASNVRLNGAEKSQAILKTLDTHSVKAALFVRASNIDNAEGKALLKPWNAAGHLIGNHTYSHLNYDSTTITAVAFQQDTLRAESLLKDFARFRKVFRFPYLKEGETAEKRDAMRTFLGERGYRTGHVTIDTSEWIIDDRLRKRLTKEPSADLKPYRDFYLAHMWDRAQYYDDLARKVSGRGIKHTILMHFNLLNALFLGDLIDMFKRQGWQVIEAEDAFTDPVFAAQPKNVPAGESIIWALAKETGKYDKLLRYPAEAGEYETPKMDKLGL
jgi:peptidoglycan/xylan/chitin deacetylase (PgdA/CDA1 family)